MDDLGRTTSELAEEVARLRQQAADAALATTARLREAGLHLARAGRQMPPGAPAADLLPDLLPALGQALNLMGVAFVEVSFSLVGADPEHAPVTTRRWSESQGATAVGSPDASAGGRRLWQGGVPACSPDPPPEDADGSSGCLAADPEGPPARSRFEVPFAWGTIAVSSDRPDAFSAVDREGVQILAALFEAALSRHADEQRSAAAAAALAVEKDRLAHTEEALRLSERRWSFALDSAGDGLWDWDATTNRVFFSRQWKAMLGYEDHEIGSELTEWDQRVHPEDRGAVYFALGRHLRGETPMYSSEHRVRAKDGSYRWVLDRGRVLSRDADGQPQRVIGTHTDITARKQAEEALGAREEQHRCMLESSMDGIVLTDTDGHIIEANETFGRMLGYERSDDLIGHAIHEFEVTDTAAQVAARLRHVIDQGREHFETRLRRRDGSVFDAEVSVRHVARGQDRFVAYVRDITPQRRAEQERERTLDLLRVLGRDGRLEEMTTTGLRAMRDWSGCGAVAIRLRRGDGFVCAAAEGFPAGFATDRACPLGIHHGPGPRLDDTGHLHSQCLCHEPLRASLGPQQGLLAPGGGFWTNDATGLIATLPGTAESGNACLSAGFQSVAVIPAAHGGTTFGLLQFSDPRPDRFTPGSISLLERLAAALAVGLSEARSAEALRESQEVFARVFYRSPALMALTRLKDGVYVDVNDRFCEVTGYSREEVLGHSAAELALLPATEDRCGGGSAVAAVGTVRNLERLFRTRDGQVRTCLFSAEVLSLGGEAVLLSLAEDITEAKRVAAELELQRARSAQAGRLQALGEMAAGIAHELNQPLNGIRAFAEGATYGMDAGWAVPLEEQRSVFSDIIGQVDRMSSIIEHMRTFARDRAGDASEPYSLAAVIENTFLLLGAQLRLHGVRVDVDVPDDLPPGRGAATRIEQVVLNLVVNARDALYERAARADAADAAAGWAPRLSVRARPGNDGSFLSVVVADNGDGVPVEVESRIFDPFFTTKPVGQGTGLGLSIALSIVKEHGGRVELVNAPGQGASFALTLPTAGTDD